MLGAQRWLKLGPFTFQPGELAKFAVILFVAAYLDRKKDLLYRISNGMIVPFLVPLPAMLLLLLQPDFGTTVLISTVILALMFLGGVPLRFISAACALATTAAGFLTFGTAYRRERVHAFLNPWADPGGNGFQILQSMLGLHNGRFWGVGLGNGKEKLFYLPEAHNDFILSVIGEEVGFFGILLTLGAYIVFIYFGLRIALSCLRDRQDRFGMLLATGITLSIGLQGFANMAVVMGLVPTKGLTLPLISYGGSALFIDLFAIGILLSIGRGRAKPIQRVDFGESGLPKTAHPGEENVHGD